MLSSSVAMCTIVDIVQNSPYRKRRQFGRSRCNIPRKAGATGTSGWLGVELVFAGFVCFMSWAYMSLVFFVAE